jgi:hypothetical protein
MSDTQENGDERPRKRNPGNLLRFSFLAFAPVIPLLSVVRDQLPVDHYWALVVAISLLWLRTAVSTAAWKLSFGQSKGRRDFRGQIDEEHLDYLRSHINDPHNQMSTQHVQQFALGVLAPQVIRRRLTDEYTPGRRTLTKKVVLELDQRVLAGERPHRGSVVVTLTLPAKGALYDQMQVVDDNGRQLPRLSHFEYRLLAARTLRALLLAALKGEPMTPAALAAESLALREIIRFADVEQDKRKAQLKEVRDAMFRIADAERHYLKLAIEFTAKLSGNYAIAVLAPRNSSGRSIVIYTREIIPDLRSAPLTSLDGQVERFRMYLGTRPNSLVVSARNAVSCQSYHLSVKSNPDLFLADFDAEPVRTRAQRGRYAKLEPYWRVRGRRGQDYFHMYTRALRSEEQDKLTVRLNFYEVPPGSVGRSSLAALAIAMVVLTICVLSGTDGYAKNPVDNQIAAFLLAVPGLAAAWMGFETRADQMLQGTVVSRLSLVVTFAQSFAAAVVLMANDTMTLPLSSTPLLVVAGADPVWTGLSLIAVIHAATMLSIWWVRARVYRALTTRPVGDSAVFV